MAVSDDDGQTWQRHAPRESDDTVNHCYHSLCISGGRAAATYYQGVTTVGDDGVERRRNLHSLKVKIVAARSFE